MISRLPSHGWANWHPTTRVMRKCTLRTSKHSEMHYERPKTFSKPVYKTLFLRPSIHLGYGTRLRRRRCPSGPRPAARERRPPRPDQLPEPTPLGRMESGGMVYQRLLGAKTKPCGFLLLACGNRTLLRVERKTLVHALGKRETER